MSKIYIVNKILKEQLIINNKGNDLLWKQANVIKDFCSPWDSKDIERIEFRALWDENKLFFCFKVYDVEIHVHESNNINDSINHSDRVELFFRSNDSMNPYYCLEIDPTARIMDFMAKPGKNFNFDWNWPSGHIEVKSTIEKNYFIVEGAISLQSLKELRLLKQNRIETGVYRAKYNKQKEGTYKPTWITWVNPKTETPDFHITSSFGVFELNE
ncbi:sugar-binding protein [Abyssalbus ytuae]|uniref:Carbohydrate-binding family 9-like protein n=1 Tax=Abyssalbus ytuae TaxID=2926907 RepID=A0A9E6ZIC4_9FLAO|nr:sugar-binding protein [Abyssalbus ytuae]UOB16049.1 carbohydrate-binding family 9-like protein [Abyssalbus ytuae]